MADLFNMTKAERQAQSARALEDKKIRDAQKAYEAGENYFRLINMKYDAEAALEELTDGPVKTVLAYLMAALANG